MMKLLETKSLRKFYGSGANIVKALDGVDLSVEEGEFAAITGSSGSGKTTLLHLLGGLDRPTAGKVLIENQDVYAMKDNELAVFRRRKVGFVFQAYNLLPVLTVWENITLPIEIDLKKVDRSWVEELLEVLHLQDKARAFPHQLSGGRASSLPGMARQGNRPRGAILYALRPGMPGVSPSERERYGTMGVQHLRL